jgi:hypothetical protein
MQNIKLVRKEFKTVNLLVNICNSNNIGLLLL